ncbi:uncharacterized protein LOC116933037 [Daphnia magna]|uniref:uncharacterized protein LOC116933037 n=1 Tax=Daphnia magna TaxID=35525 RepID=UPI001E1BCB41|nr:uncharacterized protein LOC116933037 [Daphnia magna]
MDQNTSGSKMWVEEHHENDKETVGLIRNLWKQVHVLTEQKLQLVPLSPFGIMAKWLCNKAIVTQNELMYDTLKRVWEGLSKEAKMRLHYASIKDHVSVKEQQSVINNDIFKIRCEITRLSLTLRSSPKDPTMLEYYEGSVISGDPSLADV